MVIISAILTRFDYLIRTGIAGDPGKLKELQAIFMTEAGKYQSSRGCGEYEFQYSEKTRRSSFGSLVFVSASISRTRAFCGLSVSLGITPNASYSAVAITRPLPTRLDRTNAGLDAAGMLETSFRTVSSITDSVPFPVPANTIPLTPLLIAAWIIDASGSMYE